MLGGTERTPPCIDPISLPHKLEILNKFINYIYAFHMHVTKVFNLCAAYKHLVLGMLSINLAVSKTKQKNACGQVYM